eukprot:1406137-Rhodomonas_salina.1
MSITAAHLCTSRSQPTRCPQPSSRTDSDAACFVASAGTHVGTRSTLWASTDVRTSWYVHTAH